MSYVGQPFHHDIFISYSHGDVDGSGESKIKQWSQAFVQELESEFKAHPKFGNAIRIFLDQHDRPASGLDPMAALSDQLCLEIGRSAVLTVLMSPHYLRSEWCGREREWWHQTQVELGLPVDGRIAVARIWPTDEDWPSHLTDNRGNPLTGFFFHDKSDVELRPQPYEWPAPTSRSGNPFREELITLVGRVGLALGKVRDRLLEQERAKAAVAKLAAQGGQVVYLHGRTEYASLWDRAAEILSADGLVVLPGEPDPVVSDSKLLQEIRQHRVETMSGCDALLLVGPDNGRAVDADMVVVGRQDRNSARDRSNRLLPCALLNTAGSAIATPARRAAARSLLVQWIDADGASWMPNVRQWLHDASQAESPQ